MDIDESGAALKFQSQTFKVARYCVRRKLEETDLPQGSAAGDSQLNFDWEMSQPLVLPSQGGDSWDLVPIPDDSSIDTLKNREHETQSTASPKAAPLEDSTEASEPPPRPDDPVPMSLDSEGPVQDSSPSDESWAELHDCTCGNTAPVARDRSGEKRPRSPEFAPEKRIKQDAMRLPFVENKEIIKAHCTHHLAAADGAPTIAGMESAFTARIAPQCDRPLGQELSAGDVHRFAKEAEAAKRRELDAWSKFQVYSPVLRENVAKDIADTRWVLTWKLVEGKRKVKVRLAARGFQDPDLAAGLVGNSSCVSLRSSHLQAISPSALEKWEMRSLGIKILSGGSLSS